MKNLLEKTEYSRISTAEEEAEKRRREREDERGDSGEWWPSVRSGRVSGEFHATDGPVVEGDGEQGEGDAEARRKKRPSFARIGRLKPGPPKSSGRSGRAAFRERV